MSSTGTMSFTGRLLDPEGVYLAQWRRELSHAFKARAVDSTLLALFNDNATVQDFEAYNAATQPAVVRMSKADFAKLSVSGPSGPTTRAKAAGVGEPATGGETVAEQSDKYHYLSVRRIAQLRKELAAMTIVFLSSLTVTLRDAVAADSSYDLHYERNDVVELRDITMAIVHSVAAHAVPIQVYDLNKRLYEPLPGLNVETSREQIADLAQQLADLGSPVPPAQQAMMLLKGSTHATYVEALKLMCLQNTSASLPDTLQAAYTKLAHVRSIMHPTYSKDKPEKARTSRKATAALAIIATAAMSSPQR